MVASEAKHPADDGGGALAAFQDLVDSFLACLVIGCATKPHLGVVDDGREDVVELVGNGGCQSANGGESLGVKELLPQQIGLAAGNHQVLACHRLLSSSR